MKKSSWHNNIWLVTGVCAIGGTTVGTLIYDRVKDKPILTTILNWLGTIWGWVKSFLNFELKVWWLIVAILAIALVIIIAIAYSDKPVGKSGLPAFTSYKKDRFLRWTWRWDWALGKNGWDIINLTPFCNVCDTQLVNRSNYLEQIIVCPRCNKTIQDYAEGSIEIETLIRDNVRKEHYPDNDK